MTKVENSNSTDDGLTAPALSRRLSGSRIATRLAMTVERLWPLIWPLVIVACLYLAASWSGLFRALPDLWRFGLGGLFVIGAIAALYPLRFFRVPTAGEIDRRIEGANRLEHTPVLVQTDRVGTKSDSFADALWREHQNRMAQKLRNLAGDMPRSRVPDRDPWGLRAIAPLLALIALAFSYGPSGGSLSDAFSATPGAAPVPPRIDAWVTPPTYTGKAPIFLTADNNRDVPSFTVPSGSEVTVRVTGGAGDETLGYTEIAGPERMVEPAATTDAPVQANAPRQFTSKLSDNGTLQLRSGDEALKSWAFSVTPDNPPTIRFSNQPSRATNGALELHYEIKDDYGAASAAGDIALADPQKPGARPLYEKPELPLSLPRRNADPPVAKTTRDLTQHVWAGARVNLTLTAEDGARQKAKSEQVTFTLPERTFTNPLARAVIEMRRLIALDANEKVWVAKLIDSITLRPEDTFETMAHYLAIMSVKSRLELARTDDEMRGVVDYLWEVALGIEDGEMSTAEKRLRQAQEALKQALERGASDEEISKLMQELRQAMNDFLREFAERAMKNPQQAQEMQPGQELTQSDLERMMDQIEELAKSGNRDQAQELLSQLEQMMQNLQAGRQQQGGENGQQSQMREQMNKLGEIMRRQQQMMNETFRTERGQRQPGQQGEGEQSQNGQGQGQGQGNQPMTPEEFAEAMKRLQEGQGQLQQDLGALSEALRGMGMQPGEGFGQAGEEMGQAGEALGGQEGERATGHQGRALEALRRGAQDMMQQMQQAMGEEGEGQNGARQRRANRDPLGRQRNTQGSEFDEDSVSVPDEIDIQRARQILEAIRERLGNALSPELERSYLERLLEMR